MSARQLTVASMKRPRSLDAVLMGTARPRWQEMVRRAWMAVHFRHHPSFYGDTVPALSDHDAELPPVTQRAVPLAVHALSALLERYRRSRRRLANLVRVERAFRQAQGDPFPDIPHTLLAQAIEELETLLDLGAHSDVWLLHLQMRRKLYEHEARRQAATQGLSVVWKPTKVARQAVEAGRPSRRAGAYDGAQGAPRGAG